MRTEHCGRRLQTHLPVHALARQPASPRARLPSRARRADWHGVCQRSSASTFWENCKSAKHYGNRSSERLNCPWPWRRVLRIVRRAGLDAGSAKTFTRQWITAQRLTGHGVAGAVAAGDGRQEEADYQTRKLELGSDGDGLALRPAPRQRWPVGFVSRGTDGSSSSAHDAIAVRRRRRSAERTEKLPRAGKEETAKLLSTSATARRDMDAGARCWPMGPCLARGHPESAVGDLAASKHA